MRKLLLSLVALLCSVAVNAESYYLIGDLNGWSLPGTQLTEQADGTYVINIASLTGGFKVMERPEYNGNGWRPIWYATGNSVIALGEPISLKRSTDEDGANITLPSKWTSIENATVTFNPTASTIVVDGTPKMDALDLWIVGSMTGWSVTGTGNTVQMTTNDGDTYTATLSIVNNPTDPARFKIGKKGGWGDFGLADGAAAITAPSKGNKLVDANVKDIMLDVADGSYLVTFHLSDLTLDLEQVGAVTPSYEDLYVTGSFCTWDTPGGAGTFKLTADKDGVYSGIIVIHNMTTQDTRFQLGYYNNWTCFGAADKTPIEADGTAVTIREPGQGNDIYVNAPNGAYMLTFDCPALKLNLMPCESTVPAELSAMLTGNSICDFWDNTDPQFFAENRLNDTGISGQVCTQILDRFDTEVLLENPAMLVIVSPTSNDIAGNPGAVDHNGQIDCVRRMIEKAKAKGCKVILTNNLPSNYFFWNPSARPGDEIVEVNGLLEDLATEMGVTFVDLHSLMKTDDNAIKTDLSGDGCHPNAAGYEVMKAALLPVINKVRQEITSVEEIAIDPANSASVYYNLQGMRVDNPSRGIYIREQGAKVSKVAM